MASTEPGTPTDPVPPTGTSYPWHSRENVHPLQVEFELGQRLAGRRAGLVSRALANSLDVGVVVAILLAGYGAVCVALFLVNPRAFQFPRPSFGTALILGSIVQSLYFLVSWLAGGQTYGDRVLGLRVLGPSGRPLGFWLAALRAACCVLVPIGLLWVAVSPRNRSAQDVLLRTSVVYDWSSLTAAAGNGHRPPG